MRYVVYDEHNQLPPYILTLSKSNNKIVLTLKNLLVEIRPYLNCFYQESLVQSLNSINLWFVERESACEDDNKIQSVISRQSMNNDFTKTGPIVCNN